MKIGQLFGKKKYEDGYSKIIDDFLKIAET
jgi:hypothetical protein